MITRFATRLLKNLYAVGVISVTCIVTFPKTFKYYFKNRKKLITQVFQNYHSPYGFKPFGLAIENQDCREYRAFSKMNPAVSLTQTSIFVLACSILSVRWAEQLTNFDYPETTFFLERLSDVLIVFPASYFIHVLGWVCYTFDDFIPKEVHDEILNSIVSECKMHLKSTFFRKHRYDYERLLLEECHIDANRKEKLILHLAPFSKKMEFKKLEEEILIQKAGFKTISKAIQNTTALPRALADVVAAYMEPGALHLLARNVEQYPSDTTVSIPKFLKDTETTLFNDPDPIEFEIEDATDAGQKTLLNRRVKRP